MDALRCLSGPLTWSIFRRQYLPSHPMTSTVPYLPHQAAVASIVCVMTCDIIVLAVTWLAAYNMGVLQCTSRWKYTSFWRTLFHDGEWPAVLRLSHNLTQAVGTIHFWYNACASVVIR